MRIKTSAGEVELTTEMVTRGMVFESAWAAPGKPPTGRFTITRNGDYGTVWFSTEVGTTCVLWGGVDSVTENDLLFSAATRLLRPAPTASALASMAMHCLTGSRSCGTAACWTYVEKPPWGPSSTKTGEDSS